MHGAWEQFLKVAVAHLLAVASPGPDFAMVLRQSIRHGRRTAVLTSIGIGSAILVHVAYAALGIGLLLRANRAAFTAITLAGAAYLAWIGVKSLASRSPGPVAPAPGPDPAPAVPGAGASWVTGFVTNVLNPKVTLFFVALFVAVLDPRTPRLVLAGYGLYLSAATMAWFTMVSLLFTREPVRAAFLRCGRWIDRAMGVVLIAIAAALAVARIR